jgi:Zn-dependent protease
METLLPLVILIISIIAHEVAHGYAADSLGDPTARLAHRLTLNPIPHIDLMGSIIIPALLTLTHSAILFGWAKPVPYNPYNLRNQRWGEAIVAVAGSATNIAIAIFFGLIIRYSASLNLSQTTLELAGMIAFINLFLGLFNLIPFPPLDGFTALRGALPWHMSGGFRTLEHWTRTGGAASLVLFLLFFSYIFAGTFFTFVAWVFGLIVGPGI